MKKQITLFSTLVLMGFSVQAADENMPPLTPDGSIRLEGASSQPAQGPLAATGETLSDARCGANIPHQVALDASTKAPKSNGGGADKASGDTSIQ